LLSFDNLGDAWNHVEFNGKNLVVKVGTVVFDYCSLCIFWSFESYGGTAKELTEFVAIKAANFKFSNFLEKFLFNIKLRSERI
jgi:hypothetical protein